MKDMVGKTFYVTHARIDGVITDVEFPWGVEEEPLYTLRLDDGRIAYATNAQLR